MFALIIPHGTSKWWLKKPRMQEVFNFIKFVVQTPFKFHTYMDVCRLYLCPSNDILHIQIKTFWCWCWDSSVKTESLVATKQISVQPEVNGCVYLSHLHPGRNYSHLVVKFSWTYHWAINCREVILNRFQNIQDCFLQKEARVCVSNAFVLDDSMFK